MKWTPTVLILEGVVGTSGLFRVLQEYSPDPFHEVFFRESEVVSPRVEFVCGSCPGSPFHNSCRKLCLHNRLLGAIMRPVTFSRTSWMHASAPLSERKKHDAWWVDTRLTRTAAKWVDMARAWLPYTRIIVSICRPPYVGHAGTQTHSSGSYHILSPHRIGACTTEVRLCTAAWPFGVFIGWTRPMFVDSETWVWSPEPNSALYVWTTNLLSVGDEKSLRIRRVK